MVRAVVVAAVSDQCSQAVGSVPGADKIKDKLATDRTDIHGQKGNTLKKDICWLFARVRRYVPWLTSHLFSSLADVFPERMKAITNTVNTPSMVATMAIRARLGSLSSSW